MSRRSKVIIQALMGVLLCLCLGATLTFLYAKINTLIDADEACELVLGKLLSEERSLLSKNWFYGNELRILDVQIVNSLLFRLTDNWHIVRFASCAIHILLLMAVYFLLCKAAGITEMYSCSALVFAVPFGENYLRYALIGSYIPHFLFSFGTWAVLFRYIDGRERARQRKAVAGAASPRWRTAVLLFLTALIALFAGLEGARQFQILCLPLAMVAVVLSLLSAQEENQLGHSYFPYMGWLAAFCMVEAFSYFVGNKVLHNIYTYYSFSDVRFIYFNYEWLPELINGWVGNHGYQDGFVFSSIIIRNLAAVLWIVMTFISAGYGIVHFIRIQKDETADRTMALKYFLLAVYYVAAAVVYILFYTFTNIQSSPRYSLQLLIMSVPMICFFIKMVRWNRFFKGLVLFCTCGMVALGGLNYCRNWREEDPNAEYWAIAETLRAEDYSEGFATFWNGSILTELSNGQVEVWSWHPTMTQLAAQEDPREVYRVLQRKSHDEAPPAGRMFVLLQKSEIAELPWAQRLDGGMVLYESEQYIARGYADYASFIADRAE
ncbi:MAG: hypothetical protein IJ188_02395 [Clostridia bacterium]|nr:hypothetical protein [Clostridia bacterium]